MVKGFPLTTMSGYNGGEVAEMRKSGKVRVLLAEDHAVVREGTRRILEWEKDMEVVGEAADGEEAIRLALALKPDVLLLDIAMPKANGVKVTQEVKAAVPATAVLILSAYDDDAYLFEVLKAGAAGYLLKSARGHEVVESIRAITRGESVLHPQVAAKVLRRLVSAPGKEESGQVQPLTRREVEVLKVASGGLGNKGIAQSMNLSPRTVQAHLGNIFNKLGVSSRTEAVIAALRQGIIRIEDIQAPTDTPPPSP